MLSRFFSCRIILERSLPFVAVFRFDFRSIKNHSKARLAQSVEHETLNLRVVGSSPTLGDIEILPDI